MLLPMLLMGQECHAPRATSGQLGPAFRSHRLGRATPGVRVCKKGISIASGVPSRGTRFMMLTEELCMGHTFALEDSDEGFNP